MSVIGAAEHLQQCVTELEAARTDDLVVLWTRHLANDLKSLRLLAMHEEKALEV
jgi:hypothetical protein